jgi:hypothetical protein
MDGREQRGLRTCSASRARGSPVLPPKTDALMSQSRIAFSAFKMNAIPRRSALFALRLFCV